MALLKVNVILINRLILRFTDRKIKPQVVLGKYIFFMEWSASVVDRTGKIGQSWAK